VDAGSRKLADMHLHSGIGWLYLPAEINQDAARRRMEREWVAIRIRIGTRKSVMALAQTEEIARRLTAIAPDVEVEVVKFETTGDQDQTGKLLQHGGKGGAFVAEIRRAVLSGQLHAAMHSLKDMPGNEDTPGLVIGATLSRDPPGDVLVLREGVSVDDLRRSRGKGFKIGTNAVTARGLCAAAVSGGRGDSLSRRRRYPRPQARSNGDAAASRRRRGRAGGRADHGALRAAARRLRRPHRL